MYIEKEDLFDNFEISGQFIMSGMEPDKAIPQNVNAKRITVENEHYHLLQKEDYNNYNFVRKSRNTCLL